MPEQRNERTAATTERALRNLSDASYRFSEELKALLPPMSRSELVRDLIGYHAENLWWRLTGRV